MPLGCREELAPRCGGGSLSGGASAPLPLLPAPPRPFPVPAPRGRGFPKRRPPVHASRGASALAEMSRKAVGAAEERPLQKASPTAGSAPRSSLTPWSRFPCAQRHPGAPQPCRWGEGKGQQSSGAGSPCQRGVPRAPLRPSQGLASHPACPRRRGAGRAHVRGQGCAGHSGSRARRRKDAVCFSIFPHPPPLTPCWDETAPSGNTFPFKGRLRQAACTVREATALRCV